MRARTLPLVFLLTAMGTLAGLLLAPSHKEIALMYLRDSEFDKAQATYEGLYAHGDNSINVTAPLVNLHIHYGDIDKAIELLEDFVASHPHSADARRQLAGLYKASLRLYAYCDALEGLQNVSPSAVTLRSLADTYDFLGRYPDEIHALTRLIASHDYQPIENDYVKLAVLDRVAGQPDEAIRVIVAGIKSRDNKVNIDTAHLAVQLLLEEDKDEKAFSLATRCLKTNGSEADAIALSSFFQGYGKLASAYDLLKPYLFNVDRSLPLEEQLVSVLLAQGKDDEAFTLTSRQFAQNIMPPEMAVTLIDLAIKRKNADLVESVAQGVDLRGLPETALLRDAEFALEIGRPHLAVLLQDRLGKDYLQEAPLLAALLGVAANDTPETIATLLALPPNFIFLPEDKIVVAGVFMRHGYHDRAYALLDGLSMADILGTFDAAQVSEFFLGADESAKGERKLGDARAGALEITRRKIDDALFLLAVGEGKADFVRDWLKDHVPEAEDASLLADANAIAGRYHHAALMLEIAQELYKIAPTDTNLLELADALVLNKRYGEAAGYLRKPAAQAGPARALYIDTVVKWIRQAGMGAVPKADLTLFESAMQAELRRPNLSAEEKHALAYMLEQAGLHGMAETLFVAFAANQPFNSKDVNDLLGFWGADLSPAALGWIEMRARNAAGPEKILWLSYLNDAKHPERTATLLRGETHFSSSLLDVYIDALEIMHDKQDLARVLTQAIGDEENTDRLKALIKKAEETDAPKLVEEGWRKLYALAPDDDDAARELGLLAYDAGNYAEAKKLLWQYLQSNTGDYRLNYAYAEILQHTGKKSEAESYLKEALQQVLDVHDITPEVLLDQADLLYANHQIGRSIDLYRKLLSQNPQNKRIRATFAEILIENKKFDEASAVLAQ